MSYLPTTAAFLIRVAAAVFLHAAFSAWQGNAPCSPSSRRLPADRAAPCSCEPEQSALDPSRAAPLLPTPLRRSYPSLPSSRLPCSPVPPPHAQIIIEALVAFTALIIGVAASAPPLKEISWASEMKTRCVGGLYGREESKGGWS